MAPPSGTTHGLPRFAIARRGSSLKVHAYSEGALKMMGHDPTFTVSDFDGEVRFDPEHPDRAALDLRIDAGSLTLQDNVKDRDRKEILRAMNEEVLEVSEYPEIVFHCEDVPVQQKGDGQFEARLEGDLSLHGQTRRYTMPVNVTIMGGMLRADGETRLRQSDFGIERPKVAGGMLRVKDELTLSFNIVARKEA